MISLKCHCGCGLVVYKEKSLGPETEVPYFVIPGKETRDAVSSIVAKMKPEMVTCNDHNNPLTIMFSGSEIKLFCKIKTSQVDRKMIDQICGCGGAICVLCNATRTQANDPNWVSQGMPINREIDDVIQMANSLFYANGTKRPGKKNISSDDRNGVTQIPMEKGELGVMRNIPQVHSWINSCGYFQHIGHHLNARVFKQGLSNGRNRTKEENEAIKLAKLQFQSNAKYGPLALRLGEADGVSGGTSDTG